MHQAHTGADRERGHGLDRACRSGVPQLMNEQPTSSSEPVLKQRSRSAAPALVPRVFINYRRDDAAGDAGRLFDALSARFGKGAVFMDVEAIRPGAEFADVIKQAVSSCDVVVTVIGKNWLSQPGAAGRRRLDDRHDLVRLEIQSALESKLLVVPVLVQGAQMPRADQLPRALTRLAGKNAHEISYARWQHDVEKLIATLERPTQERQPSVHNLPRLLTTFVGRSDEVAAVKQTLAMARLLTLTGPGGCGKTRIAVQAAAEMLDGFRDGVWLVDLAPLTDADLVLASVMHSLGGREEPGRPLSETLSAFLFEKRLLLILDNCEHLIATAAGLVSSILADCPEVRVLATSREPLRIAGEAVRPVPPMTVATEAVALLADRAEAVGPGFELEAHRVEVEEICRRLDGNPLAIELAAARTNVLSPAEILARLEDRFRLLTEAPRTAAARHRTLRAAVDWSYGLLDERERALFRRLSVFSGGFSLDAAEGVCSTEAPNAGTILHLLGRLVEQSLVAVSNPGRGHQTTRYRLLETLREYGLEKLEESHEVELLRRQHAAHFLALAEAAEPRLLGRDGQEWLDRLDRDRDNLRAVFDWPGSAEGDTGLRLAAALCAFWDAQGAYAEGRARLTAALARDGEPSSIRAEAMRGAGLMAWAQGDHVAARSWCELSLEMCREIGDREGEGACLQQLAQIAFEEEDFRRSRGLLHEALAVAAEVRDEDLASLCTFRLGVIALFDGDVQESAPLLRSSLESGRRAGHDESVVMSLLGLAHIAIRQERLAEARELLSESLEMWRDRGGPRQIASMLDAYALHAAAEGDATRALRLVAAAEHLRKENAVAPSHPFQRYILERLRPARESLAQAGLDVAASSVPMTREEAIAYALGEPF